MNITDVSLGTVVKFVGCNECTGKSVCFFCKEGVHKNGEVVAEKVGALPKNQLSEWITENIS